MPEDILKQIEIFNQACINNEYACTRLKEAREWKAFALDKDSRKDFDTALQDWVQADIEKYRAERKLLDTINSYKFW